MLTGCKGHIFCYKCHGHGEQETVPVQGVGVGLVLVFGGWEEVAHPQGDAAMHAGNERYIPCHSCLQKKPVEAQNNNLRQPGTTQPNATPHHCCGASGMTKYDKTK